MSTEINKQLTRRWFEEVWNQKRSQSIDELITPNAIVHGVSAGGSEPKTGSAAFRPFWEQFCGAFPDARITIEDLIAEGDKVASRIVFTGTHQGNHLGSEATGKTITVSGIVLTRWENGRIAEAWNEFDALKVFLTTGVVKMA
ncbi:MAG TPA: ester cyclase [Tepidisphaeraceae bacterium]|jgi:hypothetical protein|nr:ester cyclase [Tepidisphaeraceae bacterium]